MKKPYFFCQQAQRVSLFKNYQANLDWSLTWVGIQADHLPLFIAAFLLGSFRSQF